MIISSVLKQQIKLFDGLDRAKYLPSSTKHKISTKYGQKSGHNSKRNVMKTATYSSRTVHLASSGPGDRVPRGFLSGNLSRFHQHFCGTENNFEQNPDCARTRELGARISRDNYSHYAGDPEQRTFQSRARDLCLSQF